MTEAVSPQALLLEAAEQKQRLAADPTVSAWVRANAGTGKTHVLVRRILRLLLSGAGPRSILCLTFTKNAAAEMEARVLSKLGEWATAGHDKLKTQLAAVLARAPSEGELAIARCLFATVIDAPGGLAIMTIHSFCERVLRRYSFEANVPPGFKILTEEESGEALREAMAGAFASAADGPLREALNAVVAYASEEEFSRVLRVMIGKRNELIPLFRMSPDGDPVAGIIDRLRTLFGLAPTDKKQALLARSAALLDSPVLQDIILALGQGSKADLDCKDRFEAVARAADDETKCGALREAFCTKGSEPRKSLMTAPVKKRASGLHDRLLAAQDAFLSLDEKLCGLKAVEATAALLHLTAEIFERYEGAKRGRAALDFDDLIERTFSLLSRQEAAEWVLYELDTRIDHILVDEAQDTSPEQWAILEKLTSEFFAGQGARDCVPTLFAVGDEKQSIYGFQGAVPELLGHYGAFYETKTRAAGYGWRSVDLDLSFRTLGPVLAAVDDVSRALPDFQSGELVPHLAYRRDSGGLVEVWEPERGEKEEKGAVWEPEADSASAPKPAAALAKRIAARIKRWLESGEALASCGRPIEPGDILILLRKRAPMANLLQAELKREGIPAAGADRMALLDELAVMDLLALADALLQPEDDLSLAAVLKSPLFGLTEEDLFGLAFKRPGSLWQSLQDSTEQGHNACAAKLIEWRDLAFGCAPFDFFARILEAEGGRKLFASRLGAECLDALDEFLNLAETYSAGGDASLAGFVAFARASASEVKRETGQAAREVRIMTVHGAKGLEANIVILADTCGDRGASQAPVFFIDDGSSAPPIPIWAVKGAGRLAPVSEVKDAQKAAEKREMGRLLYVAMTRARDRLYVAGFHNGSLPEGCWYETIRAVLAPRLEEALDHDGRTVWRTGRQDQNCANPTREEAIAETSLTPSWLHVPAPKETPVRVLSPSRLIAWERGAPSRKGDPTFDRGTSRALGTLVHRLLEILPGLPEHQRTAGARAVVSAFPDGIPAAERNRAIESVMTLLSADAAPFGWGASLAEAGLGVLLRDADGEKIAVIIGKADRVVLSGPDIAVLDYKSGALSASGDVNPAHLAQLGAYRVALQRLYHGRPVEAALLNIRTMAITALSPRDLDAMIIRFGDGMIEDRPGEPVPQIWTME